MKIQRNVIYALFFLSIIMFDISYYYSSAELSNLLFISNLCLNIFGGAILALIISLISYKVEKNSCLENYYTSFHKLFTLCSKINSSISHNDLVLWFDEYKSQLADLSLTWSKISYLRDPYNHRKYLKNVFDYYNDLIILLQNDLRLLDEDIPYSSKDNIQQKINTIIFTPQTTKIGVTDYTLQKNNLTSNHKTLANIHNIYTNTARTTYAFNDTLVNTSNFQTVSEEAEHYITDFNLQSKSSGSCDVIADIPPEIIKELHDKHYISGYSGSNPQTKISCEFILFHYFELKSRISPCENSITNEQLSLNIIVLTLSLCFFIKQGWTIFSCSTPTINSCSSKLIAFSFLIMIYVSLKLFTKLPKDKKCIKMISHLGTNFSWLAIVFYIASDICPVFLPETLLIIPFIICTILAICTAYISYKKIFNQNTF